MCKSRGTLCKSGPLNELANSFRRRLAFQSEAYLRWDVAMRTSWVCMMLGELRTERRIVIRLDLRHRGEKVLKDLIQEVHGRLGVVMVGDA